ncbi:MAG: TraX family protein [Clostridia bacterium]
MVDTNINLNKITGLTGNAMKIIAIIAMTCDHITMMFMPTDTPLQIVIYQLLRAFGRFTAIIMCYLAADGFHYTKNISKYMTRLLIFAIISHFAFSFISSGNLIFAGVNNSYYTFQTSVIWSILLGVMTLYIYRNENIKLWLKYILISIFLISSLFSDWNFIAIAYIFTAEIYRDDKNKKKLAFFIISLFASVVPIIFGIISNPTLWYKNLFMLGVFPACLFLNCYNGTRGHTTQFSKWSFYIYYPVHLIIIGLIYMFTIGY